MGKLAEKISAAKTKLTQAQTSGDATKVAAAQAEVNALEALDNEGFGFTQDDVNSAVTGRLPDAEASAKNAERKVLADRLGVSVEKLDDELKAIEEQRKSQQTEAQRLQGALSTREAELNNAQAERDKNKRIAETARANLEEALKRSAVERALLSSGVVHETGEGKASYLDVTTEQALRLGDVNVEVEVDDQGNLKVKGEVTGADEATKKVKEKYPAMFGEGGYRAPSETPTSNDQDNNKSGLGGYRPRYIRPQAS